jgi:cob(I)alamin adenosyltransferase
MKIYTKKGDQGETSLFGGKRLKKYELRLEAYGGTDELNSFLGLIISHLGHHVFLEENQKTLFVIGSHLAADPKNKKINLPKIDMGIVSSMEYEIDQMNDKLPELSSFILPGGSVSASYCHLARCVCRRVERQVVKLSEEENINSDILVYLNRLSDYLFVLARYVIHQEGGDELRWLPEM